MLITKDGMSIRFHEADVRSMGRAAGGVRGISLEKGDAVVAAAIVVPDAALLVAGENGIGKRTGFDEYPRPVARRQRHHHHEDRRQDRRRGRRADRARHR